MSDTELNILMKISDKLNEIDGHLEDIRDDLKTDRMWVWRILALTIIGAFALIGVKLILPS